MTASNNGSTYQHLPITQLRECVHNPRQRFDEATLLKGVQTSAPEGT